MHSESDSERIQLSVNDIYRRLSLYKDVPVAQLRVLIDEHACRTFLLIGCGDPRCESPLVPIAASGHAQGLGSMPEDNDLLDTDVCIVLCKVIAAVVLNGERNLGNRLRRLRPYEVMIADTDALALLRGLVRRSCRGGEDTSLRRRG